MAERLERPVELASAVEENEAEFLLAMGRAGGGHERCDEDLHWTIGGSPIGYHNAVVRADLAPEDADAAIAESQTAMRAAGVAGSWHVGPSMRPDDLGARLEAQGFEGGSEPGMAADLDAVPELESPPGLTIERVVDVSGLDDFESVLAEGFGEGPPEAHSVRTIYERIGLDDDTSWRHYVGRLDGESVATASMFFAAGVAGIYFVCTVPELRQRGFGAAITHHAMLAGRELGFRTAVLGSSPMGHRVYERLGFREICSIEVYEWGPG